jgi:hypothetical protein
VVDLRHKKNACLWLNGKFVHVLKTDRNWYGSVAFRQGHTVHEKQWPLDWSSRAESLTKYLPDVLTRYGLEGWHLRFLLGGADVVWKRLPLETSDARETVCPMKWENGSCDWNISAYPSDTLAALCKVCADAGSVVESIALVPSFFGRLQPKGNGFLTFQEAGDSRRHTVYLTDGLPLVYEVNDNALPRKETGATFCWQPDDGEEEALQPNLAVRGMMEKHSLSQETAVLALL